MRRCLARGRGLSRVVAGAVFERGRCRRGWRHVSTQDMASGALTAHELLSAVPMVPELRDMRTHTKLRTQTRQEFGLSVRCLEADSCKVQWQATFLRLPALLPAGKLVLRVRGEHNHTGERASGKLLTPRQAAIAQGFVAAGGRREANLRRMLHAQGVPDEDLPVPAKLSDWLHRESKKQRLEIPGSQAVVSVVHTAVEAWPTSPPTTSSGLYIVGSPVVTEARVCVMGMDAVWSRLTSESVCLSADAKMKTVSGNLCIATVGVLLKDGLRMTTLQHGKSTGRVQGRAFATRWFPVLQAVFHRETEENWSAIFQAGHGHRPGCLGV